MFIQIIGFSWREAHSSTGRLVTGTGGNNTKLSITRSIFKLEAPDFAWYSIYTKRKKRKNTKTTKTRKNGKNGPKTAKTKLSINRLIFKLEAPDFA